MTITELQIENVKRIAAVRVCPTTGKPVTITGDNGAGKSSILDSLLIALTGAGLEDPIRHGSSRAVINLKIGDKVEQYDIKRVIRRGSKELVVSKDGKEISSPQKFLDSLVGSIAFDPLEFVRLKPKAQAEMLRSLLGIDTTAIEKKKADAYAERTMVNRQYEQLKAQLASMPEHADDVPDEEVSAADLIAQRDAIQAEHSKLAKLAADAKPVTAKVGELMQRIAKGKALLAQLEDELETAVNASTDAEHEAMKQDELVSGLPSIESLTSKIQSVDLTNQAVREKRQRKAALAALEATSLRSDELTRLQAEAEEEKARLLKAADLPVPGMEISEDGVSIGGTMFSQLSTAEQITTSAKIAMRSNPKLKIILIREGALINSGNMAGLCKLAEERGYQVWTETFRETPGSTGLHIVDGSVAYVDGKEVE